MATGSDRFTLKMSMAPKKKTNQRKQCFFWGWVPFFFCASFTFLSPKARISSEWETEKVRVVVVVEKLDDKFVGPSTKGKQTRPCLAKPPYR